MSLWQFSACVNGYAAAHSSEQDNSLTTEEADDLWKTVQESDRG